MKKMCLGNRLIFLNFIIMVGLMISGFIAYGFYFNNLFKTLMGLAFIPLILIVILSWLGGSFND